MTDKGTVRFRNVRCEWGEKGLFTLFRAQLQLQPNYTCARIAPNSNPTELTEPNFASRVLNTVYFSYSNI